MPGSPLLVLQRGHKEISFGDLSSSFFCVCLFVYLFVCFLLRKSFPFYFKNLGGVGRGCLPYSHLIPGVLNFAKT